MGNGKSSQRVYQFRLTTESDSPFMLCDWLLSSIAEGISRGHTKHELINLPWNCKEIEFRIRNKIPKNGKRLFAVLMASSGWTKQGRDAVTWCSYRTQSVTASFKDWSLSDICDSASWTLLFLLFFFSNVTTVRTAITLQSISGCFLVKIAKAGKDWQIGSTPNCDQSSSFRLSFYCFYYFITYYNIFTLREISRFESKWKWECNTSYKRAAAMKV